MSPEQAQGSTGDHEDPRVRTAQTFFQAYFEGDVARATKALDPDVRYRVTTAGRKMTTYEGVTAVVDHLKSFLKFVDAPIDVLQWEDWLAGINYVAGLARVHLQHDRALHDLRLVLLTRIEGERIQQIDIFFDDPEAFHRFLIS
jgi:hypothetical protein